MRSSLKLITILLFIFSFFEIGIGQTFEWQTGINGFFDNREYQNPYAISQTIFGSRLFGTVKISLNRQVEIGTGLNVLYEFGDKLKKENVEPTLFLHYSRNFLDFYFGSFPRRNLITLPNMLQSDTIQYYRPNCEGLYLELKRKWGYQSAWLDWTSHQGDTIREIFQIGGTGIMRKGIFFYQHDFIMTHYAKPADHIPNNLIRDNGGLYAGVGVNLSPYLFDSLTISTGFCFSYDRIRDEYDLTFRHGSLTQLYIEYYGLGIRSTVYVGEGQLLMWSDNLYRAKYYTRLDLVWHLFRKKNISGSAEFSLHIVDNILDVSQTLKIYATIGDKYRIKPIQDP